MHSPLIAIAGEINAGKDTVGSILQWISSESGKPFKDFDPKKDSNQKGYEIVKFAGKLKERVALTWGVTVDDLNDREFKESKHPFLDLTWRQLLQKEGQSAREIDEDYWVKALFSEYLPKRSAYGEVPYFYSLNGVSYECKKHGELFTATLGAGKKRSEAYLIASKAIRIFYGFPSWVVTDLRHKNEVDKIYSLGGYTIRVVRPGYSTGDTHISETELSKIKMDYLLINNGSIEDLIKKVIDIYYEIRSSHFEELS